METHPVANPPACPYRSCAYHRAAPPGFFRLYGFYRSRGYPGGIRRFRCRSCQRSFSMRRFSVEFRLHRPDLTPFVIHQLVSCVSVRQSARAGLLGRAAIERRLDRFGRHGDRLLARASRRSEPLGGQFQLDEAESFEGSRRARPVTIPVLIHSESRFMIATRVGALAPRPSARKPAGAVRRTSESSAVVRACLRRLVRFAQRGSELASDQKPSYRAILREIDRGGKLHHLRYSSKLPRGRGSPLFDINHTLAMLRDGIAKLRRQTWCHAKKRKRLQLHLALYALWRNFQRKRFNRDRNHTPAQFARVSDRRWSYRELVRWRVDLGDATICPLRLGTQCG